MAAIAQRNLYKRPHDVKRLLSAALANACDLEVKGFARQHAGDGNAVLYDGDGEEIGSVRDCCLRCIER